MSIHFHPYEDVIIIDFYDGRYRRTETLDDDRHLEFDGNDDLVRVTFHHASGGVRLEGIPGAREMCLDNMLRGYNVKVLD